jgi:poly(3-hydroxybutyrate) depolymerase
VTLVVIEGGGHAFPQPTTTFPPFFGATNGDINAAAVIWQFFSGR